MALRIIALLIVTASYPLLAQLTPEIQNAIDATVKKTLSASRVASASVAVVKDGKVAHTRAYGEAKYEPATPASPGMRYKTGSNTKQFTASAILFLQEEGKLSLDDAVSKYLPGMPHGDEITIRQLLSHTSGYEDYYPLDYVAPFMVLKTSAQSILDTWGNKPLNFDPGTKWQYSNTNYIAAGQIVEKVAGKSVFEFLREKVFAPLGMKSVIDADADSWDAGDPVGYTRFALGPSRPALREGSGWAGAAGELAMTPGDMALWDISLMQGSLLKPDSVRALTTEVVLKNGSATHYALGLAVSNEDGRRKWAHSGGVAGFISHNLVRPDDRISVTVFTNQDDPAAARIAGDIEAILIAPVPDPQAAASLALARKVYADLQNGKLDHGQFTADANAYFTPQAIADFAASLKPLGDPISFTETHAEDRGGMRYRFFAIKTKSQNLTLCTFFATNGKLAQYLIYRAQTEK